jgi:hypothetical protein
MQDSLMKQVWRKGFSWIFLLMSLLVVVFWYVEWQHGLIQLKEASLSLVQEQGQLKTLIKDSLNKPKVKSLSMDRQIQGISELISHIVTLLEGEGLQAKSLKVLPPESHRPLEGPGLLLQTTGECGALSEFLFRVQSLEGLFGCRSFKMEARPDLSVHLSAEFRQGMTGDG